MDGDHAGVETPSGGDDIPPASHQQIVDACNWLCDMLFRHAWQLTHADPSLDQLKEVAAARLREFALVDASPRRVFLSPRAPLTVDFGLNTGYKTFWREEMHAFKTQALALLESSHLHTANLGNLSEARRLVRELVKLYVFF